MHGTIFKKPVENIMNKGKKNQSVCILCVEVYRAARAMQNQQYILKLFAELRDPGVGRVWSVSRGSGGTTNGMNCTIVE